MRVLISRSPTPVAEDGQAREKFAIVDIGTVYRSVEGGKALAPSKALAEQAVETVAKGSSARILARQDPAIYHTVLLHHVLLRIGPKLEEKEYLAIEAEDVRAIILYSVSVHVYAHPIELGLAFLSAPCTYENQHICHRGQQSKDSLSSQHERRLSPNSGTSYLLPKSVRFGCSKVKAAPANDAIPAAPGTPPPTFYRLGIRFLSCRSNHLRP